MELKLTLYQRFQSFKNYIDTELRDILAAFFEKIEHVANEIDFLAFYIKNNLICDDFNAVAQSALVITIFSDEQDVNSYAESAILTANNFLNSCQPNGECVAQNESVIWIIIHYLKLISIESLRRAFTMIMQNSDIETMRMSRSKNH